MADPLSITVGVAGLISLGLQTTEYLVTYYTKYKDRNISLARTTKRLEGLLHSLRLIDDCVRKRRWRADETAILRHVEASILSCKEVIGELDEEVTKFKEQPQDSIATTIKSVGRKAAYPFRESTLAKLAEDVNDLQSNLSTALESLHLKSYGNIQDDVDEIKVIVSKAHARAVAADVRQWLNAPDVTIDLNNACSQRHGATGSWFIKSEQYKRWLQEDNSFLWLYGFAGCGKSVLCSTAIQHAFRHRAQGDGAVAFFFFTFRDDTKQDATAMMRALLLQLCEQVVGVEDDLVKLKQSYKHGTPPIPVLQEYLRHAISRAGHVFIILDALDECPEDDQKQEVVLSTIQAMRAWSLAGLHLLVTSRDYPDIRQALNPNVMTQLVLKGEGVTQDIDEFITHQIENDDKLRKWHGHCEMIKQHLVKHANGVFRWVECQLGGLRRCPRSEKHLKQCLQSLPRTLDATYERMLCSIREEYRDEALRLLTLLCFSSRPLSIAEIIDALAVDLIENCYDGASRLAGSDDLLQICPGLINLYHYDDTDDKDSDIDTDVGADDHEIGDDNTNHGDHHENTIPHLAPESSHQTHVQIAHFSVQEYLLSNRIAQSPAGAFSLSAGKGHAQLSKTCLIYLCNQEFVHRPLTRSLLCQYPFAHSAACFWYEHYCKSDASTRTQLDTWSYALLAERSFLDRCVRLYNPDTPWRRRIEYEPVAIQYTTPLYYASLCGLDNVISRILKDGQIIIDALEGYYGSAIQAASAEGHLDVVRLLLKHGADVNIEGGHYGSALQAASERSHPDVVRLLLEHGADANAEGGPSGNALQAASIRGHLDVVRLLLEHRADTNGKESLYGSVLQAASVHGHLDVVRLLLEYGADTNAEGGRYGRALQAASLGGHMDVFRLLLEHGADVNAGRGRYGSALEAASIAGRIDVMRLLLEHGVDANAEGGRYGRALQVASAYGYLDAVRLLLEHGADVNAERGPSGSALEVASACGHWDIVRLLKKKGAR